MIVALILWVANRLITDQTTKNVLNAVVAVILILWLIALFFPTLYNLKV